jgi:predicted nucleotidyltransferase
MYIPNKDPGSVDDKDAMAVCVPPLEYYFGLEEYHSKGTREVKRGEWDIVIYEARKMLRLLKGSNPNVLMTLWLSPKHYIKKTEAWGLVLENRDLFVSKQAYHAFTGYAYSQLHRMTHMAFEGYMGEKRRQLVEKFGYDTKNAAHLVRLLRMGIEFLVEGCLYVERPDAQQLLEIKRGEWTLEQVKAEANRLFVKAEDMYTRSALPIGVDKAKIGKLCADVVQLAISGREK